MMSADLAAVVEECMRLRAEHQQRISRLHAEQVGHHQKAAEAQLEAEESGAIADRQAGDRLRAGRPISVKGRAATRNATARASGHKNAADLVAADIAELEAQRPSLERTIADALLVATAAERIGKLDAIILGLTAMAPALSELAAVEGIQLRLIGDRFSFDRVQVPPADLWHTGIVVSAFLAAIPPRLRPAGWPDSVLAEAQRITKEITS
jgi:hypothetical protein